MERGVKAGREDAVSCPCGANRDGGRRGHKLFGFGSSRAGIIFLSVFLLSAGAAAAHAQEIAETYPEDAPHSLGARIAAAMRATGMPDAIVIPLIATLPVVELRGAVPVGHMLEMHPLTVYILSVLGNMLPVPLLLLWLGPVSRQLMRWRMGKLFFDWLFARTRRKASGIEKYETLGLVIFVSIPLPVTGAWTGSVAAFLMGLRFPYALGAILLGVMIAGVIMTALSLLGWWGALLAAVALISTAVVGLSKKMARGESTPAPPWATDGGPSCPPPAPPGA